LNVIFEPKQITVKR